MRYTVCEEHPLYFSRCLCPVSPCCVGWYGVAVIHALDVCSLNTLQVEEQRELAVAEMRSHREFSHPNLMPLLDCAVVGVPQGEAAFMLLPFMDSECLFVCSCIAISLEGILLLWIVFSIQQLHVLVLPVCSMIGRILFSRLQQ